MKKILIATKNEGKLKELSLFLSGLPIEILSLKDLEITEDFEEKGKSYKENSRAKALFFAKRSNLPTIADDAGIEIDALDGAPGLKSRRWIGKKSTDEEIIKHMFKVSKNLPDNNRKAYFRTIISLALPNGKLYSAEGSVEGIIARKPYLKTLKGYPYRSFFYFPQIKKYYHEDQLTERQERMYNHRYKAIQKLIPIIRRELIP